MFEVTFSALTHIKPSRRAECGELPGNSIHTTPRTIKAYGATHELKLLSKGVETGLGESQYEMYEI